MSTDAGKWIPEVYRLIRDEVPGGKLLAPLAVWVPALAGFAYLGGVAWRGIGAPVMTIFKGGASALPQGQLGSSAFAVVLFLLLFWVVRRYVRSLLGLILKTHDHSFTAIEGLTGAMKGTAENLDLTTTNIESVIAVLNDLMDRVRALEKRRGNRA